MHPGMPVQHTFSEIPVKVGDKLGLAGVARLPRAQDAKNSNFDPLRVTPHFWCLNERQIRKLLLVVCSLLSTSSLAPRIIPSALNRVGIHLKLSCHNLQINGVSNDPPLSTYVELLVC